MKEDNADINPFDYVSSASYTKKHLMTEDKQSEKAYVPWLSNKAFSYHSDSILHANQMNQLRHIDNRLQYEFYFNSLRKRKRFAKFKKSDRNEDVTRMVANKYKCNMKIASQYLSLLTDEDIDTMKKQIEKGGIKNGNSSK